MAFLFFCMQHVLPNGSTLLLFLFILTGVVHIQCFPAFSPHDLLPAPFTVTRIWLLRSTASCQVLEAAVFLCRSIGQRWVTTAWLSNPRTDSRQAKLHPSRFTGCSCPCLVNSLLRVLRMLGTTIDPKSDVLPCWLLGLAVF